MIDTKAKFKGRRVLVENDPLLSEEENRRDVRVLRRIFDRKILDPMNEIPGSDLLPQGSIEPEVAYDEIICLRKRQ